jgi:hypothetical protein
MIFYRSRPEARPHFSVVIRHESIANLDNTVDFSHIHFGGQRPDLQIACTKMPIEIVKR